MKLSAGQRLQHILRITQEERRSQHKGNKDANALDRGKKTDILQLVDKKLAEFPAPDGREAIYEFLHTGEILSAENYPSEVDKNKGDGPRQKTVQRKSTCIPYAMHNESRSVHDTPENKGPRRAVPQTAEKEGEEKVAEHPFLAFSVAAQRDIQIVAEPARKRDVPAPPEILDIRGLVWRIEVPRQFDPEHEGTADGHVAVAREIEVQLESVAERTKDGFTESQRRRNIEDIVHKRRKIIRHKHLLGEADAQHDKAAIEIFPVHHALGAFELWHHLAVMDDRASDKLREEADKKPIMQETLSRRIMLLGIDVGEIGYLLEGEKGNAYRQSYILQRKRHSQRIVH